MTEHVNSSAIERTRRLLGRAGFMVAVAALALGAACFTAGEAGLASFLFRVAIAVLIVMPIRNVVALLIEETFTRDWFFVGLAAAALTVLVYAVVDRL